MYFNSGFTLPISKARPFAEHSFPPATLFLNCLDCNFKHKVWLLLYCLCTMIWSGFFWPSAFTSFHHLKFGMCSRAYEIHCFIRNYCHLSRLHAILCVLVWFLFDLPLTFLPWQSLIWIKNFYTQAMVKNQFLFCQSFSCESLITCIETLNSPIRHTREFFMKAKAFTVTANGNIYSKSL